MSAWGLSYRTQDLHGGSFTAVHELSSCGTQAQWLWPTGLIAPWHMGSYRILDLRSYGSILLTEDWTGVPCIAGWTVNHWTTREVLTYFIMSFNFHIFLAHSIVYSAIIQNCFCCCTLIAHSIFLSSVSLITFFHSRYSVNNCGLI